MVVRKIAKSWQNDYKTPSSNKRHRRAGFRTKAEALAAERREREEVINGHRKILFADAYQQYLKATKLQDRTKDSYDEVWTSIEPALGQLHIEEVTTSELDRFKQELPEGLGARSINKRLALVRTVLRFMWKRQHLKSLPYIPTEAEIRKPIEWYSTEERDAFLGRMFEDYPRWFLFFSITMRLGLRTASRPRRTHRGTQSTQEQRSIYGGDFKRHRQCDRVAYRDGLLGTGVLFQRGREVSQVPRQSQPAASQPAASQPAASQRALGLRELSHHKLGRHSVGSQAAEMGHTLKAIQAQLGHRSSQSTVRYLHAGDRSKLRLVTGLAPSAPPHAKKAANDEG